MESIKLLLHLSDLIIIVISNEENYITVFNRC